MLHNGCHGTASTGTGNLAIEGEHDAGADRTLTTAILTNDAVHIRLQVYMQVTVAHEISEG